MNKTARLALAFLATFPLHSNAELKTWIGTDGQTYSQPDAWNPAGVPAPSDDILLDGGTLLYAGSESGDWAPQGLVTIRNGALWRQTGIAWPNVQGTLLVEAATLDFGEAGNVRLAAGSALTARAGASVKVNAALESAGAVRIEGGAALVVSGGVVLNGGSLSVEGSKVVLGEVTAGSGSCVSLGDGGDLSVASVSGFQAGSSLVLKGGSHMTVVGNAAVGEGVVV
ncbi:MAG: hypothetical protein ACI4QD_06275 [Kiritimatiellia bacterium]